MTMTETKPLVSAIIPTYNRRHTLPRAIDSALAQTYQNLELIVVDDRSTDDTEALVREYSKKDPRIKYVKNTRKQGTSGARNDGVDFARGEYIAFLDSDDEWKPFHLERMVELLEKNGDIDLIWSNPQDWPEKNNFILEKRGSLVVLNKKNLLANAIKHYTGFICQSSLMRRRVLDSVRFAEDLRIIEDILFPLEVIAKGFVPAYVSDEHFTYYVEPDSICYSYSTGLIEGKYNTYLELERLYETLPRRIPLTSGEIKAANDNLAYIRFWVLGYNYYLKIGDRKKAKEYFLKGIRMKPFNLKFWKTYIAHIAFKLTRRNKEDYPKRDERACRK